MPESKTANIAIIAAVARGGVVGGPDGMPWSIPADMKHFRELTTGHTVIMGRTTWESLSGPLKDRQNIVLTSQTIDGVETASSLEEAVGLAEMPGEIFVIGGVKPWTEALGVASTSYLTHIDAEFKGNVFFPVFDQSLWTKESEVVQESMISGTLGTLTFTKYTRDKDKPVAATDKLQEIKRQADRATQGPWEVGGMDSGHSRYETNLWIVDAKYGDTICDMDGLARAGNEILAKDSGEHDAFFMAESRTNVPLMADALLAVLELHQEDVWRGYSNGCVVCGHAPEGPAYPCKTVIKINQIFDTSE